MAELIAQGVLLLVALAFSALVTVRTNSIIKGALCLYGFSVLWVFLFAIVAPWVVPLVTEADGRDVAEVFPTQIGVLPILVFAWIPALVFASLVNSITGFAERYLSRRGEPGSVSDFSPRRTVKSLFGVLAPAADELYPRGVGALLGIFLPGSAHFLMGKKWAALRWYLAVLGCWYLVLGFLAIPGRWALFGAGIATVAALLLHLRVLKQSYRPVRRIGLRGWVALFVIMMCLGAANRSVTRLGVHAFRMTGTTMEPTICGIHSQEIGDGNVLKAQFWAKLIGGRRYVQWRAAVSGEIQGPFYLPDAPSLRGYRVGADARPLPVSAKLRVKPGEQVLAGQLIYSGFIVTDDRVLAEKVTYRFRDPRRGELIVFRTDGIQRLTPGKFFAMRVVGLPGERVQIDPPHLVIDGQKVAEPPIFARIALQEEGYSGFQLVGDSQRPTFLDTLESEVVLGEDEYLVLGDNSENSYDSRMWGPVPRKNIVGRVTRIYWPLDRVNALGGKW